MAYDGKIILKPSLMMRIIAMPIINFIREGTSLKAISSVLSLLSIKPIENPDRTPNDFAISLPFNATDRKRGINTKIIIDEINLIFQILS